MAVVGAKGKFAGLPVPHGSNSTFRPRVVIECSEVKTEDSRQTRVDI